MSFDTETLYGLLPQVLRSRDEDGTLRALVAVLAEQARVFEEDLARLYDNHFIETCEEWAIPYIGALVGTRGLALIPERLARARNEVANTIRLRRRKGTAAALGELTSELMDCEAVAVEFFRLLATSQALNHPRPDNESFAKVRAAAPLEDLGKAFDTLAHRVEVRSIASGRGRYNLGNVGLFVWPLHTTSVARAAAFRIDERRYTFDPLGRALPLLTRPGRGGDALSAPRPISRRRLARSLPDCYGLDQQGAILSLLLSVDGVDLVPERDEDGEIVGSVGDLVEAADLSDVLDSQGRVIGWATQASGRVLIDPELGRIAFAAGRAAPASVEVSYQLGRTLALGGGYPLAPGAGAPARRIALARGDSLQLALTRLGGEDGIIEFSDSDRYAVDTALALAPGQRLVLRAQQGKRPVLDGELCVSGGAASCLALEGLLLTGGALRLGRQQGGVDDQLGEARVSHCTLAADPATGACLIAAIPGLVLSLDHSVCGALRVDREAQLAIDDSIVDAGSRSEFALSGPGGAAGVLAARNATVIGRVLCRAIERVENTLFVASGAAAVRAEQIQSGCVRFCYLPPGSVLPRPYRCQPGDGDATRIKPVFESLNPADPRYGVLAERTCAEIRCGADDEAAIGAFHDSYLPQRAASLAARLQEYLRFGLEAGVMLERD